jgi:hypothetical protein
MPVTCTCKSAVETRLDGPQAPSVATSIILTCRIIYREQYYLKAIVEHARTWWLLMTLVTDEARNRRRVGRQMSHPDRQRDLKPADDDVK